MTTTEPTTQAPQTCRRCLRTVGDRVGRPYRTVTPDPGRRFHHCADLAGCVAASHHHMLALAPEEAAEAIASLHQSATIGLPLGAPANATPELVDALRHGTAPVGVAGLEFLPRRALGALVLVRPATEEAAR